LIAMHRLILTARSKMKQANKHNNDRRTLRTVRNF